MDQPYEVGTKVVVVNNKSGHKYKKGDVVIVIGIEEKGGKEIATYSTKRLRSRNHDWYVLHEDIEHVATQWYNDHHDTKDNVYT